MIQIRWGTLSDRLPQIFPGPPRDPDLDHGDSLPERRLLSPRGRHPPARDREAPVVNVRYPDLEHWKAQVKCQAGCPVSTDAGRYVQLIAEGKDAEAYLVARMPNPLASVCGRVCAAPCEDACRRGSIDAPIAIRALKRFVTERHGVESVHPDTVERLREALPEEGNRYAGHVGVQAQNGARRKVAVVGAGPAGLAAAHDL